jgi:hypothetical protein
MNSNQQNNDLAETFSIKDIRITNAVISLPTLAEKLRLKEIDIHPNNNVDYIWGDEKMSRLIEAILLKIPLPIFYFDVSDPVFWYSIDGFQRLNTINRFIVNRKLTLHNMEVLKHLNGKNYRELADNYKRIIYNTQLITYQIEAQTPPELRELIFRKIRDINAN